MRANWVRERKNEANDLLSHNKAAGWMAGACPGLAAAASPACFAVLYLQLDDEANGYLLRSFVGTDGFAAFLKKREKKEKTTKKLKGMKKKEDWSWFLRLRC